MKYPKSMDTQCIALCDAINLIAGLRTVESCCGHGRDNFRIWFVVEDLENLPVLLYFSDPCHVKIEARWDCLVRTDCGMAPATFMLQSRSTGAKAYREAQIIADEITAYLADAPESMRGET